MVQVTIDVPEEFERKAKMLRVELSLIALRALEERMEQIGKWENFEKSIANSKLTEKDVDELSDKINTTMWEHHKKKYNL